jgi:RND family efflux transporter MFP subunit
MKFILALIVISIQLTVSLSVLAEEKWVGVEPAMRKVTITAFTRAQSKMPLATEVEGKVSKIFADIGEPIPATKKFACLDDTFAQIDIKSAQNEMTRHDVDIKYFKKEVSRHKKLVERQTSAVSVLDGLTRDLNNAKQALTVVAIRKQRLEEHKRRHCIEAPEGWLVIDRNIEVGQWVNEGEVVAHVGNYSQLKVPVTLSQQELTALKRDKDNITLLLMDFNLKVPAIIEHISPAFDEKTRKILVDLLIKESLPELRGGMRVGLMLKIPDPKSTSFTISKQALEERFEEYWLQRKDGKKIRVKLLSDHSNGKVSISSREIKLGDQFKIIQH